MGRGGGVVTPPFRVSNPIFASTAAQHSARTVLDWWVTTTPLKKGT